MQLFNYYLYIMDNNSYLINNSNNKQEIEKTKLKTLYHRKVIGYILLLFVIVIMVISSIWVQQLSESVDIFLLTYIDYSFWVFFIPFYYIKHYIIECYKRHKSQYKIIPKKDASETEVEVGTDVEVRVPTESEAEGETIQGIAKPKFVFDREFYIYTLLLMLFWYFGNCFYNLGLTQTSITSANALSNIAILFLLFQKVVIFKKKCSMYKIISVVICMTGIGLMAYYDSTNRQDDKKDSLLGDFFVILGALFYSCYATLIKHFSKKCKDFDMMLVFGYIGLFCLIIGPFFLIIFHLTGLETFKIPSGKDFLFIFINVVVAGYIADFFQSYSIVLLAPHIVSFGLTMSIPLSYLWEFFKDNMTFSVLYLVSSVLIIISFSVIFLESYKKYQRKKVNLNEKEAIPAK
jgi:solute carrier family 35 protein F5